MCIDRPLHARVPLLETGYLYILHEMFKNIIYLVRNSMKRTWETKLKSLLILKSLE